MGITDLAGLAATLLFAASHMPMLVKAMRTRDVHSYSLGNLVLVNVGNATYTLYVLSLPMGPIWILHMFYLVTAAIMLTLFLRAGERKRRREAGADRRPEPRSESEVTDYASMC
ncbi:hypothetical protein P0L94_03300 [Microbacter sp. GSS18]|nr:hypothetical protein P0L94_03300 [Microbacter sp. GSS18]